MKLSKPKQFLIVFAAFLVMGIPFKVMVLVEGFTEVRPGNAIPPVAGMLFGPWGALACGLGNVICDMFGTFNLTSILGFFGNILAAYIPYRLWYIYSEEQPNLHKNINILKYALICLSAALTLSWFLGFGLHYFFATWIEDVYTFILFNTFGFSVGLGIPLMIMMSSDDVRLIPCEPAKKYLILRNEKLRRVVPFVHTAALAAVMVMVMVFHVEPEGNIAIDVLSVVGLCGTVALLV